MEKLTVDISSNFNRITIPELENLIEDNWKVLKQELGGLLYNDDKFRIHAVKQTEDNKPLIEVGLTNYKEYIGTNLGTNSDLFVQHGINEFNNAQACLSDALGVGSLVITADGYLLFVRRSFEVAEGQGMMDVPGGHAEPKVLRQCSQPGVLAL